LASLFGLALVIGFGAAAQAQIAKSGTYSGWFGWHSLGETTQLQGGDLSWIGQFNGAFRNDAGSGFLHNTSVICPGALAVVGGEQYFQGNCILTDQDGDKAVLIWNCQMNAQGRCPGPLQWVGGTGKYKGIRGTGSFDGGFVFKGPQRYSFWKGDRQLP
jgi:hypothetical protein